MKLIEVTIEGVSPLLQHRWSDEAEASVSDTGTRKIHIVRGTPREEAEKVCYRTSDGELYLSATAIHRMLIEAGGSHKQKGSRKSMKYVIPAAVLMTTDVIILHDNEGNALTDYEVDSRPVVIPSTKGRIMRHRPRLDEWWATFSIRVNEELVAVEMVRQLLNEGGMRLGVGDFRPQKFGPFGTFDVINWAETEAKPRPRLRRKSAAA